MRETGHGRDEDDAYEDSWPHTVAALEACYGSLVGRLQAVEEAAREHVTLDHYGPHLHLLQMHDIDFGLTALPSGLGWWMPEENAIALDHRLNRHERRSVLAHLLVHAEQGDPTCRATWMHQPPIARRCSGAAQAVAAERFLPVLSLTRAVLVGVPIPRIAHYFGVVEEVVHTRLDSMDARQRQLMALLLDGDELRDGITQVGGQPQPGRAQTWNRTLDAQRRHRSA